MARRVRLNTDVLLAATLAAAAEAEVLTVGLSPLFVSIPATLVATGALAWRQKAPVLAALFAIVPFGVESWLGVDLQRPVAPIAVTLVAAYSVGAYAPLRRSVACVLGLLAALSASALSQKGSGPSDVAFVALLTTAPWLVGIAMSNRVRESQSLALRAEQLVRERELHAEAAAAAERGRIARELHDVIAHSLSVMIVQAGAAEEIAAVDPRLVVEPLRSIQQTGREALAEMSRLLGILRDPDWHSDLAPQPSISELGRLIGESQHAGMAVDLRIEGTHREVSPGVDLSVYRIIQESLTNARKHGEAGRAQVRVRYDADAIELEVLDDGSAAPHNGTSSVGKGLIGMQERVSVFGGTLSAGPRPEGGFRVFARLPAEDPTR